ncbi:hypothetical protein PRIPAC_91099 [Pristionchus pacificus]|uniref:Uncharacterized protein n=1 Tax=Pristionchus pacificus TaxID=54126 RepID=A0A2A6B9M6_PRIPA|nr:hypothetical protein PRIPAC_91099 [Pristionchus pacificus]|eukprot:PDM62579.1 hypothetical protein PRIPAC_52021 [Pristionchus pacificus]
MLFSALFAAADSVNPCDRSLIRDATAEEVNYDHTTKTLTCKDGSNNFKGANCRFGSSLYKMLTRDEVKGWKDGYTYPISSNKLRREGIANATEPISVKCVEYCAVDGPVESDLYIDATKNTTAATRMISCEDTRRVFYNGKQMFGLRCLFDFGGWISDAVDTPLTTPLKVECRPGCTQGDRTDMIQSLSDEVFIVHVVKGTVYPSLECDSKDGYTYGDNHTVADAFDVVDMQCDILPEPTTTTAEPEPPAPPPPGPKTPTNEEHTSDDEDTNKAMVIIGCMSAALVIVIILIVIMCIKRRRDEEEERQREEKRQKKREERKKEERRREEESRTETGDVSEEV